MMELMILWSVENFAMFVTAVSVCRHQVLLS